MSAADSGHQAVNNETRRLCIALLSFIILSTVGAVIAVELSDVWLRSRVDPDFQSFCAVSEGMNCETVALSDYSTVMGSPVSVWATAGYLFIIVLALFALARLKDGFGRGYLFLFSIFFALVSLLLIYIMKFEIGSLCLLCLGIDAINLGLLVMSFLAIKAAHQSVGEAIRKDFAAIIGQPLVTGLVVVVGVGLLGGAYVYGQRLASQNAGPSNLTLPDSDGTLDSPANWTSKVHNGECSDQCGCHDESAGNTLQMGTDGQGRHWIGAAEAELEIEEFTDYECPYCRQAHMMVRKLLSNYPGKVKVYHRHYPLDQACNRTIDRPFHARACELSRIAECASRQGRFWEMNDFLFQHAKEIRAGGLSAEEIAKRLELNPDDFACCMEDDSVVEGIKKDIEAGIEHHLKGTPAFIIDGTVYYGKIPDEAVAKLKK